ncbi:ABC transporter permease [Phenylobacterium sp.]|uniref:ABC transporter permease n=1 Tax=Phenylobacterium sp. TaxID=1871053 RepID=UPI002FC932B9
MTEAASEGRTVSFLRALGQAAPLAHVLAVRELRQRYARSYLGAFWMVATPVLMLLLYWMVFGQGFGVSWTGPAERPVGYVAPFFAGLIVYLLAADVIPSSLNLFIAQRTLVQRSAISLEAIWLSNLLRAAYYFGVSFALLTVICLALGFARPYGLLLGVVAGLGALWFAAAVSLILASIGPFFGDAANIVQILLRALFYAAPIAYPLTLAPEIVRPFLWLNPLTPFVVAMREAMVFNSGAHLPELGIAVACAAVLSGMGAWLLRAAARAIPDVV